jgi:uncharacterized protein (TIGR00266 family)
MRWEIAPERTYPVLRIFLEQGEEVIAEPSALLLMQGPVRVDTGIRGGLLQGLMRSLLGGESIFLNTFRAEGPAQVWLAPAGIGDIHYVPLNGESFVLQDFAYLAHHGSVEVSVAWRGFRGFLTEGELVWLKVHGTGGVWVSAFGAIEEIEVPAGETVTVDNFHFVGMVEGAQPQIRMVGGLKTILFGGEGLVVDVKGPARLLIQSRHMVSLAQILLPIIRRHVRSGGK